GSADASLGAENQELAAIQLGRIPAHAGILRQTEEIAAGGFPQQFGRQRQTACRAGAAGLDGVNRVVGRIKNRVHSGSWRLLGEEIITTEFKRKTRRAACKRRTRALP